MVQDIIKFKCEGLCWEVYLSTARRNSISVRIGTAGAQVLEEISDATFEHEPVLLTTTAVTWLPNKMV